MIYWSECVTEGCGHQEMSVNIKATKHRLGVNKTATKEHDLPLIR